MAITTTTISKAAGWAGTDVVYQLEEAFTWLGWHSDTVTGIVTSISSYSGGGTVVGGSSNVDYHDVFPVTTTGIGTGASFYVRRTSGVIDDIRVNRPGYGYTDGEYVTLSAEDTGGSANGATGIGITVNISAVGYGSTNQFFSSEISGTYPWGVLKHEIQANKKFGNTYRSFQPISNTAMYLNTGSGFHPFPFENASDRGNMGKTRFAGSRYLDINVEPDSSSASMTNTSYNGINVNTFTFANSTSYQLDLNIYRSSIDPNFAVFSYRQPTLSSTSIGGNNFATFFLHNFTSSLWDYDYLFLGGVTFISPQSSAKIHFDTYFPSADTSKRSAEYGWSSSGYNTYKRSTYESSIVSQSSSTENSFYYRASSNSLGGASGTADSLDPSTYYNAVIKGIPLSTVMIPCPYYLPDDFVLIDFQYNIPLANIQQGDTITISGSEVYTVITGSYDQTGTTRGLLFCARTV